MLIVFLLVGGAAVAVTDGSSLIGSVCLSEIAAA